MDLWSGVKEIDLTKDNGDQRTTSIVAIPRNKFNRIRDSLSNPIVTIRNTRYGYLKKWKKDWYPSVIDGSL